MTSVTSPAAAPTNETFDDPAAYHAAARQVLAAAEAYYADGTSPIDDVTYDALLARCAATEAAHPDWAEFGLGSKVAAGTSTGTVAHQRLSDWTARKEQWRKERAAGNAAHALKPPTNDRPEFAPGKA